MNWQYSYYDEAAQALEDALNDLSANQVDYNESYEWVEREALLVLRNIREGGNADAYHAIDLIQKEVADQKRLAVEGAA